jgi:hypothetical protein
MATPLFEFADEIQRACQYCATIGRANLQQFFERGFVPRHTDATATVTFIRLAEQTYAVTAGHVITTFDRQSAQEKAEIEPYSVPAGRGALIQPPFIRPPATLPNPEPPDLAITPISADIPGSVGKLAFDLRPHPQPKYPVAYAVAVGFPTIAKMKRHEADGTRIAMRCVHAIAHGLGAPVHADQITFFSEIERNPEVTSLSGMSGGPVFWSDANQFGLLGFVKEALDVLPTKGEDHIYAGPRVTFIIQHSPYEIISAWAE